MQKAIVAIGGGEIRTRGTTLIDRAILRLSKKRNPRVLFIPTASSDSEEYWKRFQDYFGNFLRCKTDVLFLSKKASKKRVRGKILSADVIYVGGGNTLRMMRMWRRQGVDKLLVSAYRRGTVLSGISAGAICWFESGHSDSMSFYNPRRWKYINVQGLGLIKGVHCPHYNGRTRGVARRKDFRKLIERTGGFGIAMENNCAMAFVNGCFYQVIRSKTNAKAYRVYKKAGQVVAEQIKPGEELRPLKDLYERSRFASAQRER